MIQSASAFGWIRNLEKYFFFQIFLEFLTIDIAYVLYGIIF